MKRSSWRKCEYLKKLNSIWEKERANFEVHPDSGFSDASEHVDVSSLQNHLDDLAGSLPYYRPMIGPCTCATYIYKAVGILA